MEGKKPSTRRRVSYVLPSPLTHPGFLTLPSAIHPRNGSPHPLVIPATAPISHRMLSEDHNASQSSLSTPFFPGSRDNSFTAPSHPQHSLGVAALALDCSTQLHGKSAPEGILYTGGRDGLIAAWECGIKMKKRTKPRVGKSRKGWVKWKLLGDDGDEEDDTDGDDDDLEEKEGWFGVNADGSGGEVSEEVPYEDRYEADWGEGVLEKPPPTSFRQNVQFHTDWVNDVVLCNYNQTVISASSDRTVRAWNPHSAESMSPQVIGSHTDYARCLAYSPDQKWVASGGFDRQIKLWDVTESRPNGPLTTLEFPDKEGAQREKGSIYSLATDSAGQIVAAGSPERVIRVWDPRSGKRICKLVGHTDNIRALLISEDGRFMLSGSSDTTIKLWSLSAQRVIHTYTHHSDSVWSMFSNHPNLERFYSGDRAGVVCVVDMERCHDVSEGECVVLCKEGQGASEEEVPLNPLANAGDHGINRIVAMDDAYVWTATSSSSVCRWKDVGKRTRRNPAFAMGDSISDDMESSIPSIPSAGALRRDSYVPIPEHSSLSNRRLSVETSNERSRSIEPHSVAFATQTPPSRERDLPPPSLDPNSKSPLLDTTRPPSSHAIRRLRSGTDASTRSFDSDLNRDFEEPPSTELSGIPYSNLVNLASPEDPYSAYGAPRGRYTEPDIATIYSAASVLSVPNFNQHYSFASVGPTPPSAGGIDSEMNPAPDASGISINTKQAPSLYHAAKAERRAFESREVAIEAQPVRGIPDDVIHGKHGLVRCLFLSDRRHVVTIDTAGTIALWDIVFCRCLGIFSSEEVLAADEFGRDGVQGIYERNPREALELVKDRIDGQAVTTTWCSVDTRIGGLTVHLEENSCFDAEVHVDELGLKGNFHIKEDQRVSLGRLVIAHLFSGFLEAALKQEQHNTNPMDPSITPKQKLRRLPPTHIALPGASTPTIPGPKTPGILLLATPAMTPAIIPEVSELIKSTPSKHSSLMSPRNVFSPGGQSLQPIPGSPIRSLYAQTSTDARSPGQESFGERDYFSLQTDRLRTTSANADGAPSSPIGLTLDNPILSPTTPGGSFMGRFKSMGKPKKGATAVATPVVVEQTAAEKQMAADSIKYAGLSERDIYQKKVLENIWSRQLHPPNLDDIPMVLPYPDAALFVDESSKDAAAWAVIYRGMVSSTAADYKELEMNMPVWVLEYILAGRSTSKDPVKMSFLLEPWNKGTVGSLPELPTGNSRLTANRLLRARKIMAYVVDRLEMGVPRSRAVSLSGTASNFNTPHGSPTNRVSALPSEPEAFASQDQQSQAAETLKPEEMIELVCNDHILPVTMTLAAIKQFIYRQHGDLVIYYRIKSDGVQEGA